MNIKLPENLVPIATHIAWGLVGGAIAAGSLFFLLHRAAVPRVAAVDLFAIDRANDQEVVEALKKNNQKAVQAAMDKKIQRSRDIGRVLSDIAREERVVLVVSQAIAAGEIPDLTDLVLQRLNEARP